MTSVRRILRAYPAFFSLAYAAFNVFSFYPGILYSDSYPRWRLAIDLAANDTSVFALHSSQFPILPAFVLAAFYNLTHGIGFYIFCQSFVFALSLFVFVHTFRGGAIADGLVSVALLAPINRVYSLFHSYDSVAAVALILLAAAIVRLFQGDARQRYYLPLPFLTLAAFRLNAAALLIPAAVAAAALLRRQGLSRITSTLYLLGLWALVALPLAVNATVPMIPYSTWAVGISWEYMNLAIRSGEQEHLDFLAGHGVEIERMTNEGSYHSIYAEAQARRFANRIPRDPDLSRIVLCRYIALAYERPGLFFQEKSKYTADLFGLRGPLQNGEIGKWRINSGEWLGRFATLGFHPTEAKERFIDRYISFVETFEVVILRPYVGFIAGLVLALSLIATRRRALGMSIAIAVLLSLGYYATFIVTSASHELRYYFPSWFVLQGVCLAALTTAMTGRDRRSTTGA